MNKAALHLFDDDGKENDVITVLFHDLERFWCVFENVRAGAICNLLTTKTQITAPPSKVGNEQTSLS